MSPVAHFSDLSNLTNDVHSRSLDRFEGHELGLPETEILPAKQCAILEKKNWRDYRFSLGAPVSKFPIVSAVEIRPPPLPGLKPGPHRIARDPHATPQTGLPSDHVTPCTREYQAIALNSDLWSAGILQIIKWRHHTITASKKYSPIRDSKRRCSAGPSQLKIAEIKSL
jgi:hypothetical protein